MPVKVLSVIQPSFLPWRGFFRIIRNSHLFVLYDDVQYDKHGWRNRNRIKIGDQLHWITVPVLTTGKFGQLIKDVEIDNTLPWRRKILGGIRSAYLRAPYFDKYFPWLETSLSRENKFISELDEALTRDLCDQLGIETQMKRSSELGLQTTDPVERLLELCRRVEATEYISGPSAAAYMRPEEFERSGIKLQYEDYSGLPEYAQLGTSYIPQVSILDALMCCGPDTRGLI